MEPRQRRFHQLWRRQSPSPGAAQTAGPAIDAVAPWLVILPMGSIKNYLRVRFDASYDNNVSERAEFFYAQCSCNEL